MLLPAFFSYAFRSPSQLIARCGIFWLGLMTPLIPLGIALSGVVALIREHASLITHVVAFLVICAGIITIAALDFPKFQRAPPSRFIFWGLPTGSPASDARGPF